MKLKGMSVLCLILTLPFIIGVTNYSEKIQPSPDEILSLIEILKSETDERIAINLRQLDIDIKHIKDREIVLDLRNDQATIMRSYHEPLTIYSEIITVISPTTDEISKIENSYALYGARRIYYSNAIYAYYYTGDSKGDYYKLKKTQFSWHSYNGHTHDHVELIDSLSAQQCASDPILGYWKYRYEYGWPSHHTSGMVSRDLSPPRYAYLLHAGRGYCGNSTGISIKFYGADSIFKMSGVGWGSFNW